MRSLSPSAGRGRGDGVLHGEMLRPLSVLPAARRSGRLMIGYEPTPPPVVGSAIFFFRVVFPFFPRCKDTGAPPLSEAGGVHLDKLLLLLLQGPANPPIVPRRFSSDAFFYG